MKSHHNSSSYVYAKFPRVVFVIYLLYSIIFDNYYPSDFEIYKVAKTKVIAESEAFIQLLLECVSVSFFKDLGWYLFFYILLESICKILSLIEIIGRMRGRPTLVKIKRLNNISAGLILLLRGKIIIFIVGSLLEICNF